MKQNKLQRIRQLLWLYFWLLIFEGALRKWIFPGLSSQLLLVRDPVAFLALMWGWPLLLRKPWRQWLLPLLVIGILAFLLAITVGHGDIPTAAYGARIMLLQLPLIFLYGAVFDRSSVIRFAWVMAGLSIPMTLLIATQSNLPAGHILNVAPGGEGSAAFTGALDRFRPPGTFSFISGVNTFYTLAVSGLFILVYCTQQQLPGRLFDVIAAVAMVVALPVSISRTMLFGYLQVLSAVIAALFVSRSRLVPLLYGLIGLVLAIMIATNLPIFQATSEAFIARWEGAASAENRGDERLGGAIGVFQTRVLFGFTTPLNSLDTVPIFGYGIGMGTNVGSQRLTGERIFLIGETGWEASLGELGLPLGLFFLFWRLSLGWWILQLSWRAAARGNLLPLILVGSSFLILVGGQLSQPTNLGFIVLSSGLTLAAHD
jgi:hypothetical protein